MVSPKNSKNGLLSQKQAEILEHIERVIALTGRPPTYRDLAKAAGVSAVGTVQDHVKALVKKGFLTRDEGSRGIRPSYQSGTFSVPILGAVPAGNPIEAIESSLGSLNVQASSVSRASIHRIYALRVFGESMIGEGILDGDFVIVLKGAEVRNGDIVVGMVDGEATVKTYERGKDGRVRLMPANPKFSPIEIRADSDNRVEGKVIGLQRFYSNS
jgi:repressor LexA